MNFRPIVVGALYPGITRGLSADLLATQALSGTPFPVCTAHVVAGRGVVTDVLNVPSDTVSAQLEHVFQTESPTAAKVGIVGADQTIEWIFEHLESVPGPIVFDITISGPSGEDVLSQRGLDAITNYLSVPDLVTLRLTDAALLAGMEIPSLDDAQVAAQRIAQHGGKRVLLRCGRLPTHYYDTESEPPDYALDLYFDGEDFAVFEAPYLSDVENLHGASSGLLLPVLQELQTGIGIESALQKSKERVSEALRAVHQHENETPVPVFFDALRKEPTISDL